MYTVKRFHKSLLHCIACVWIIISLGSIYAFKADASLSSCTTKKMFIRMGQKRTLSMKNPRKRVIIVGLALMRISKLM